MMSLHHTRFGISLLIRLFGMRALNFVDSARLTAKHSPLRNTRSELR